MAQNAEAFYEYHETKQQYEMRLMKWIEQMMFVSGETAEPGPETTWMIEEIVREQVLEMVRMIYRTPMLS